MIPKLDKVVFLDRDGVINRDFVDYVKSWSEYEFLPGSIEAIRNLNANGFSVIIITNQSAIHRRIFSIETLEDIHRRMKTEIRAGGGEITDIFFCPHTPDDHCNCRKPKPGMILAACNAYRIDLAASYMVGDTDRDIECAISAGCGHTILVQTGNGISARKALARKNITPDLVAADLFDAANWILAHDKTRQPADHP